MNIRNGGRICVWKLGSFLLKKETTGHPEAYLSTVPQNIIILLTESLLNFLPRIKHNVSIHLLIKILLDIKLPLTNILVYLHT